MRGVRSEKNVDRARAWVESPRYDGPTRPAVLALVDAVQAKGRAMVEALRAPYPEDVFTPLSQADVRLAVVAIQSVLGHAGSDRLHARWARDLAAILADDADEVPEVPAGGE